MLLFAYGCLLSIADYSLSWKTLTPFPVKWLWAELVYIILHQSVDLCFCGIYLVKGSSEASTLWGGSQLRIRHLMHWKSLTMPNFSSFYCLPRLPVLPTRKTHHSETPQIVGHLEHMRPGELGRSFWERRRNPFLLVNALWQLEWLNLNYVVFNKMCNGWAHQ